MLIKVLSIKFAHRSFNKGAHLTHFKSMVIDRCSSHFCQGNIFFCLKKTIQSIYILTLIHHKTKSMLCVIYTECSDKSYISRSSCFHFWKIPLNETDISRFSSGKRTLSRLFEQHCVLNARNMAVSHVSRSKCGTINTGHEGLVPYVSET